MHSEFLRRQIGRLNRNRAIGVGILVGGFAITLAISWDQLRQFDQPPQKMNRYQLLSLTNPDVLPNKRVIVKPDKIIDTGLQYEVNRRYYDETYYYHFMTFDQKAVIFETDRSWPEQVREGGVVLTVEMPNSRISETILPELLKQYPGVEGALHATVFLRDNRFFVETGRWAKGAIWFWLALSVVSLIYFVLLLLKPEQSAMVRRLKKFGDPDRFAGAMDKELVHEAQLLQFHSLRFIKTAISRSFLLTQLPFDTFVIPLREVVWAYYDVRSLRGVKYHRLAVHTSQGHKVMINLGTGSEGTAELIVAELQTAQQQMFFGYSDELQKAWKQDREAVVRKWRELKEKAAAPGQVEAPAQPTGKVA